MNPPDCSPLPKILSIPRLPSADNAPVASAGATFDTPFIAEGTALVPSENRDDHRLPPC